MIADIEYLNVNEKQNVVYCVPIWQRDEQVKLSTARIKNRILASYDLRNEPIAVVCYGPSLNDTWEQIKEFKYIISCSGSHKFLIEKGIIPTWHVEVDPREHKAELIGTPHNDVEYLIASACHPKVFDLLEGYNVKLWHVFATEEEAYRILPPGEWAIMGGCSVGLRAMTIARFMGFTDLHIFGMDGCEGKSGKHAGYHPILSHLKENHPTIYEGKTYYTTPAMLEAARQTFHELDQLKDINVKFYGEGLVQEMAKNYIRQEKLSTVIGIRKQSLISEEYLKLNKELYQTNMNYGIGGWRHAETVLEIYNSISGTSILDYGCGKGYLGKSLPFPIWEYDPAIPGKDDTPRIADLVVCTDVLEHIEIDKLDFVLGDIQRCSNKLAFFVIYNEKSSKTLSNGQNAHQIIESPDWWIKKLKEYFILGEPKIEEKAMGICGIPKHHYIFKQNIMKENDKEENK
jgi:uncharacterized Rossmann fold enzyme